MGRDVANDGNKPRAGDIKMPMIGEDLWKLGLEFYWFREYQDGRTEQEFDSITGKIVLWGQKVPEGLKRAGWLPMSEELAKKIAVHGETGYPVGSDPVIIDLAPDDKLLISKDCAVQYGYKIHCKSCNHEYISLGLPVDCPRCGVSPNWKCSGCNQIQDHILCPTCGKEWKRITPEPPTWKCLKCNIIQDLTMCPQCGERCQYIKPAIEIIENSTVWKCPKCKQVQALAACSDCGKSCRFINSFDTQPAAWENTVFNVGIEGKYLIKFNSSGLRRFDL